MPQTNPSKNQEDQSKSMVMSHNSRHSIDSCTLQLHSWRPFLDSDPPANSKPCASSRTLPKRPCLSDRATSFSSNIDSIDISKLSLLQDDSSSSNIKPIPAAPAITNNPYNRGTLRLIQRKRRRRGSRSVSGRSSDRSGTWRCCSVGAAHGTCSDFPVAVGTDSSGELFVNGDANWASDVSEAKNSIKEREEKENLLGVGCAFGNLDSESGYGSEPGYRGDAEFGYGDEVEEEEEDARLLFWGHHFQDSKMEMVGENTFDPKTHHRCRRKKHDYRMVGSLR
ncbi:mitochondrial zinc maintenance protein [Salix suchowensis]|nr:mitochondrial zinc maintenance protein [Salix suchowensis]